MVLLLILGVFCVVVILRDAKPRVTRWRGPQEGTMDQAQVEHLRHFEAPSGVEED